MTVRTVVALGAVCLLSQPAWPQTQQSDQVPPAQGPGTGENGGRALKLDVIPSAEAVRSDLFRSLTAPRFDFSVDPGRGCTGCPGPIAPPVNRNAPSIINGTASYSARDGSLVSVGVLGARNVRLPVFIFRPIGGTADLSPPPASSFADLSTGLTEWQISIGFQKWLRQSQGGTDLGVAGDLFAPLNSTGGTEVKGRPHMPSGTFRLGGLVGF